MADKDFKKAVDTTKVVTGLTQPDKFMETDHKLAKTWEEYKEDIKREQEMDSDAGQTTMSVAMEPSMKEAVNIAGKKVGRRKGGTKSIIRDALTEYFDKHKDAVIPKD